MDCVYLRVNYLEDLLPSICTSLASDVHQDTTIVCKDGESVSSSSILLAGLSPWMKQILTDTPDQDYCLLLPQIESSMVKAVLSLALRRLLDNQPILEPEKTLRALNGIFWSDVDIFVDHCGGPEQGFEALVEVKQEDLEELEDSEDFENLQDLESSNNLPTIVSSWSKTRHSKRKQRSKSTKILHEEPAPLSDNDDDYGDDHDDDDYHDDKDYDDDNDDNLDAGSGPLKKLKRDPDFKLDEKQLQFIESGNLEDPAALYNGTQYFNKKEKCPVCDKVFLLGKRQRNRFKRHVRNHKIQSYVCGCDVPLGSANERANHIKIVHWKWTKCEFCNKLLENYQVKGHYKVHKRKDKDIKEILDTRLHERYLRKNMDKLLCPDCGQSFVTKKEREEYTKHMEKHMVDQFTCDCNVQLKGYGETMQHIKVFHENKGYLACPHCTLYMKSEERLKQHKKDVHDYSHICDICGHITQNKYSLKEHHERIHTPVDQECEYCHKMFTKLQLRDHMRKTHTTSTCTECGAKVKRLKKHMETMHTPDSLKKFPCPHCPKGFIAQRYLNSHIVSVHTKTRPHKCRYGCSVAYNDASNRNQHEKRKHGALFTGPPDR